MALQVHLKIEAEIGTRSTHNVIAERDSMSGSFVVVGRSPRQCVGRAGHER